MAAAAAAAACLRQGVLRTPHAWTDASVSGGPMSESFSNQAWHVSSSRPSDPLRSSRLGLVASCETARALSDGHCLPLDSKSNGVDAAMIRHGFEFNLSRFGWSKPRATANGVGAVLAGDDNVAAEDEENFASIIDGKAIAAQIRAEVAADVARMHDGIGMVPGLAVVLVGTRKDSETYVRSKKRACREVGIRSFGAQLPEDASEDDIVKVVEDFNSDPSVHGILVQLPLPRHINEERVLAAVSEHKDVDGFNPKNIGRLAMQRREPTFVPCTPKGCVELLQRSGVQIAGKRAVVLGRSNVVGMPAALLLQRLNATVTIVHSQTPDPEEITRAADIVISAVGIPELVRGNWLKPGAVVIDVGINPVDDAAEERGYRLVGDVCFEEARKVASAITPVPGGVGPMTIAMLLQNTLCAAKRVFGLPER